MSYFESIHLGDGPQLDAFSRLRVSNPTTIFESKLIYHDMSEIWHTYLVGGGTTTHLPNEAALMLSTTATAGSRVVRQSKQYLNYQPGKSQLIVMTGNFNGIVPDVIKNIGYFDDNDGVLFTVRSNQFGICIRTSTSGTPVDNIVYQNNFNIDKLDGTGPSGITFDPAKANIFCIDLQWLGVGRVRFSMDIDGIAIPIHETLNANYLTAVYMATATLPVRYEIINVASASPQTMKQICTTVISEGGHTIDHVIRSANIGRTGKTVGSTAKPIISLKPKLLYHGKANRTVILPESISAYTAVKDVLVELYLGGTLTGPVWTSDVEMQAEYDITATAFNPTGATLIYSEYGGGASGISKDALSKVPLTIDYLGTSSDVLTLVMTSLGTNTSCYGAFTWKEYD